MISVSEAYYKSNLDNKGSSTQLDQNEFCTNRLVFVSLWGIPNGQIKLRLWAAKGSWAVQPPTYSTRARAWYVSRCSSISYIQFNLHKLSWNSEFQWTLLSPSWSVHYCYCRSAHSSRTRLHWIPTSSDSNLVRVINFDNHVKLLELFVMMSHNERCRGI